MTSPSCSNNFIFPLGDDCKLLATQIPHIRFNHCYREANKSVDMLAKLGAVQDGCFEIFARLPMDVVRTFKSELDGLYLNRVCLETLFLV